LAPDSPPQGTDQLKNLKNTICQHFFLLNLTSYSTTLRVISSGGGLGLNGFEKVCGPEEVNCICNGFRVVGESRERRDGAEKDFLWFWRGRGLRVKEDEYALHNRVR